MRWVGLMNCCKAQVAIKHQGTRGEGEDIGKLSLDKVGERNGMSGKTVQRYIYLNDLVPELGKGAKKKEMEK